MNADQAIEQQIERTAVAPRVTPADIEASITEEYFFTAEAGVRGMLLATSETEHPQVSPSISMLTFCVLVLKNGFTVTGESACVCPENFSAEIGKTVARQNAIQKVWPLLGYALQDKLHNEAQG